MPKDGKLNKAIIARYTYHKPMIIFNDLLCHIGMHSWRYHGHAKGQSDKADSQLHKENASIASNIKHGVAWEEWMDTAPNIPEGTLYVSTGDNMDHSL